METFQPWATLNFGKFSNVDGVSELAVQAQTARMGIPMSESVQSRVGMFRIQKGLHGFRAFTEEESKGTPW